MCLQYQAVRFKRRPERAGNASRIPKQNVNGRIGEMNNANKPAFPVVTESGLLGSSDVAAAGLTKREYFAAMAMCGRISYYGAGDYELCAKYAVAHADALLAALERKPE